MWQYTDESNTVVVKIDDKGDMVSCLVTVPEVQEWIAQGNEPLAYDNNS